MLRQPLLDRGELLGAAGAGAEPFAGLPCLRERTVAVAVPIAGRWTGGARVIAVPSCTDTAAGHARVRIACQARALESQCYVVQAPTVGDAPWSPAVDRNYGAGGIYVPPDCANESGPAPLQVSGAGGQAPALLTRRQELVLLELLDGRTNRQISAKLHLSEETVKNHVTAILRKLGAHNRTMAVTLASRLALDPDAARSVRVVEE